MERPHKLLPGREFLFRAAGSARQLRAGESERLHTKLLDWRTREVDLGLRWPLQRGRNASEDTMEVEMKIRGLMMDPVTNMPIVVLKDVQGNSVLPIWVGVYEANAIALEIEKVQTPRPMTHDLLRNVFLGLEVRVDKIVVNDLKDDTFYAVIWVERDGQLMMIDSRPSDALALALRMDCPIFVDEQVLRNSKVTNAISDRTTMDQLRGSIEDLSDEDFGRYKM